MRHIIIPKPVQLLPGPDGKRPEYSFVDWCADWIYGSSDSTSDEGQALCASLDEQFEAGKVNPGDELLLLPSQWDLAKKAAKATIEKRRDQGQLVSKLIPKMLRFYDVLSKAENKPDA